MITAYHGTNARFDQFDKSKARIRNDLYGGGIAYFTDSLDIAKSYARVMSKREGMPIVYKVQLNFGKTFDVEQNFTGDDLTKFVYTPSVEDFARGARMMNTGNRIQVISDLKSGKPNLKGDAVFRGISRGMQQTAAARKFLEKMGYDSLRYNGGMMEMSPIKHNVYLAYDPRTIRITDRYVVKPPGDTAKVQDYEFI